MEGFVYLGIILFVCVWLILLPGIIAAKKGRSYWGFVVLGLIISPILAAAIAACVSPDYEALKK